MTQNIPFGSVADSVLDNLSLGHGSGLLEKLLKFPGSKPGSELLDEDSASVALILGQRRR